MMLSYNEAMNIRVKYGDKITVLPDPSEWNYQVGDLDTMGKRDATGLLHRSYVTTKINYEFKWKGLEWEKLEELLEAIGHPKFQMIAPDPRNFRQEYTGDYYTGDRTGKNHYYIEERPNVAMFDLKVKFIEY